MVDLSIENRPYAETAAADGNLVLRARGFLLAAALGTPTTVTSRITGAANVAYAANQITAFVKSTDNVADLAAGTGAQRVKLTYLNLAGAVQTAEVDLNGTTLVQICTDYYRYLDLEVVRYGSGERNVGEILLQSTGGAQEFARMASAQNKGGTTVLTVPAGYVGIVREPILTQSNGAARQQLWIREAGGVWQMRGQVDIWGGEIASQIPSIWVPAMTDVELRGSSASGVIGYHRLEIACLPLAA